jgi:membrane-bound ClpP family serine protease
MGDLAWPLLMAALGLALFTAEVFIPSGGMLGVLAAGCLLYSVWLAFRVSGEVGLAFLAAELAAAPVMGGLALYVWPKTPLARRLMLRQPCSEELAVSHAGVRLDHLVGLPGTALTTLRPAGVIDIDGLRLHGLSENALIPAGSPVLAVKVHSGQLIVRAAPPTETDVPNRPRP